MWSMGGDEDEQRAPGRQVIEKARVALRNAHLGLADFRSEDPSRRLAGFQNAIVFGRSVTNVLENLRSRVPSFDDWYKPRSAALGEDPGFRRLYLMRSEILKQGDGRPDMLLEADVIRVSDFEALMKNPPPGALGFFVGDDVGGSGWEVDLGDGTTAKYYVQLPESLGVTFRLTIQGEDAAALLDRYLRAMADLIDDAVQQFALGRA